MTHDTKIDITDVRLVSAPEGLAGNGLLAWVSCTVDDCLRLEGLTLRRTTEGRVVLSFPARRDARGHQHFYVRPLCDAARENVERQVFQALGFASDYTKEETT